LIIIEEGIELMLPIVSSHSKAPFSRKPPKTSKKDMKTRKNGHNSLLTEIKG